MDQWVDIRRRAQATRASLGEKARATSAEVLIKALIENWDIELCRVAPDHPLLRGARAAWHEKQEVLAVDETLSPEEQAFAIGHELGHRVCHPGSHHCGGAEVVDVPLPVAVPLAEGRVWGYNPRQAREIEASIFSAELLAPPQDLRHRFMQGETYAELAVAYGLTPTCILNQLTAAVLGGTSHQEDSIDTLMKTALDESQRRAAYTTARFALIDAGPGTGKTRTLVARAGHLIEACQVPAHQILILTFSNKAAEELRERCRFLGDTASGITVTTFHGIALDLLRRFAAEAGLPDDFRVIGDEDAEILLEQELPSLELERYLHLKRPSLYFDSLLKAASRMRDELLSHEDVGRLVDQACGEEVDEDKQTKLRETGRLLQAYDALLERHNLVDYGGLITRTLDLCRKNEMVQADIHDQYRYTLVDEYQDTNRACAALLKVLAGPAASIWVVGDIRQAIYQFRGAAPHNLTQFALDFPGAQNFTLEVNYRAAEALVSMLGAASGPVTGTQGSWRAHRPDIPIERSVLVVSAPDEHSELTGMIRDIVSSIAAGGRREDHAILCRTHAQASIAARALAVVGLTSSYLGDFWLRPEIKDMMALLELCRLPNGISSIRMMRWNDYQLDEQAAVAFVRAAWEWGVVFPGALVDPELGNTLDDEARGRLERLWSDLRAVRFCREPATILQRYLFGTPGYLRHLLSLPSPGAIQTAAALFQLIVLARGFAARPLVELAEDPTDAFLRYVRYLLVQGGSNIRPAVGAVPGAVNVLTMHAAKGLEFPVVYVPGLRKGIFPQPDPGGARVLVPDALSQRNDDDRNLFFVALSRAQDRLVLSRPARHRHGNKERNSSDSPILGEMLKACRVHLHTWPLAVDGTTAIGTLIEPRRLWLMTDPSACGWLNRFGQYCSVEG
jgi:DNA helicase II / ATP-dependent DNA helicase PcrA